jgi:diguanylate cyclase (GGDEF)-like protein/PAS domain S-box-containing protein
VSDQRAWLPPKATLLAVIGSVLVLGGLRIAMGEANTAIASLWLSNGVVLALLLDSRRSAWPVLLLGEAATNLALNLYQNEAKVAAFVLGNLVAIAVPAVLIMRGRDAVPDLARPRELARFVLFAAVVGPLLSMLVATPLALLVHPVPPLAFMLHWTLSKALSTAVMAPLTLSLVRRDLMLLFVPPILTQTVLLLAGYVALAAFALAATPYPLLFLPFPALLLVVARLGFPGAGLGVLATALIAVGALAAGAGPVAAIPGLSPQARGVFAQAYLVVAAVMAFAVGVVVSERRKLNQALADKHASLGRSEKLHRLLAENSSDVITRVRADGRRLYVSPSVRRTLGWSPDEMLRHDWANFVHPDDVERFRAARAYIFAVADDHTSVFRYRRKDGEYVWIEARMHPVAGADGLVREFIANLRDVSAQKLAEQALESAMAVLAEQAATDGLTGVANRRRFDEVLDLEWRRAMRAGDPVAVLMIDADHFKRFNDTYGHQAGDDCLRSLARTISAVIRRPHDLAARYGGEEFAVILPATDIAGAHTIGEAIREAVEALALAHVANAAKAIVTVSIGAAALVPPRDFVPALLVEAADAALYAAKAAGRNRVETMLLPGADSIVVPLVPALRRAAV